MPAKPKRVTRRRGRFIVLDGPDGAGKSTQVKLLADQLNANGIETVLVREPGGTPAGEAIRALVLEHRKIELSALTEAFLFQAARAQVVESIIKPALAEGKWVICDRFTLSTLVYQGFSGGVDPKTIKTLSAVACAGVAPDRYLVLWVAPGVGVARRADRAADRMESKGSAYIRSVATAFKREAQKPGPYTFVDGKGSLEEVQQRIWKHVSSMVQSGLTKSQEPRAKSQAVGRQT